MLQDADKFDVDVGFENGLTAAIKAEHYEDAARFRDEITQVKQSAGPKQAD